jgi:hypothetical protein
MWSHYADFHRGFAIGFERSGEGVLSDSLLSRPVTYTTTFPLIQFDSVAMRRQIPLKPGRFATIEDQNMSISLHEPNVQQVVFTKAAEWAYEEEWRIIGSPGNVEVEYPGPLVEVVFGMRCPPEARAAISATLRNAEGANVRFRQATAAVDAFRLEFSDVAT